MVIDAQVKQAGYIQRRVSARKASTSSAFREAYKGEEPTPRTYTPPVKRPRLKKGMCKDLLFLLDGVTVNCSLLIAILLHRPGVLGSGSGASLPQGLAVLLFIVYGLVGAFVFQSNHLYKVAVFTSFTRQIQCIVRSSLILSFGVAVCLYFTKWPAMLNSRLVVLYVTIFTIVLTVVVRVLVFRNMYCLLAVRGNISRSVIILGSGQSAIQVAKELVGERQYGLRLAGFLDDVKPIGSRVYNRLTVLGRVMDVGRIVRESGIDEIAVCLESEVDDRYIEVLETCASTRARVLVGSTQFRAVPGCIEMENYGGIPMVGILNAPPYLGFPVVKRLVDLLFASLGIVLLSPLLAVIAATIKIDSRGPVLFKQERVGRDGRRFVFYKFRSMYGGAECDGVRERRLRDFIQNGVGNDCGLTKIVDESKITPMGRFIRKTSLDELPQLVNVIQGHMSLVGPRPCLPYEWDDYFEWHKKRLSILPGCTGVWQVFARSRVGFRDMVILDLFYMYNVSFHLDIYILLKTIPVILFGTGGK